MVINIDEYNGEGFGGLFPINQRKACELWLIAAEHEHPGALYALGCCYYRGEGVECDKSMGIALWRRAAKKGYCVAQWAFSRANRRRLPNPFLEKLSPEELQEDEWNWRGIGIKVKEAREFVPVPYNKNKTIKEFDVVFHGFNGQLNREAFDFITKAAENGYGRAQHFLSFLYSEGISVEGNAVKAAEWEKKAVLQDIADARHLIGLLYYGNKAVTKDLKDIVKSIEKKAEKDDKDAKSFIDDCQQIIELRWLFPLQ